MARCNRVGNHNYYGIEICQSIGVSEKQFLSNEQLAFQEVARMLKKWGYLQIEIRFDYTLDFIILPVHIVVCYFTRVTTQRLKELLLKKFN